MRHILNSLVLLSVVYLFDPCIAAILRVPIDYSVIQEAIDASSDGDIVLLSEGTYVGPGNFNIDFKGKTIILKSDCFNHQCRIEIDSTSTVSEYCAFFLHSGETKHTIIEGLTIYSCASRVFPSILCENSSPTIKNCRFICNGEDTPESHEISCINSSPVIEDCVFSAGYSKIGGAIYMINSNTHIIQCEFKLNTSSEDGGALYLEDSQPEIINCIFAMNSSGSGGAIYCKNTIPVISNCSFNQNKADNGGAITCESSSPVLLNCILWNNGDEEIHAFSASEPDVTYSDIKLPAGIYPGIGNINKDPLFFSEIDIDLHLYQIAAGQKKQSPCVDSGSTSAGQICWFDGDNQICLSDLSTRGDMGFDEDLVDMGYHYTPYTSALVYMPKWTFHPGDLCYCNVKVVNCEDAPLSGYPLFVILMAFDHFYFGPSFNEYDNYLDEYSYFPRGVTTFSIIPEFLWPSIEDSASDLAWYAAVTDPEVTQIIGEYSAWSFSWKSE